MKLFKKKKPEEPKSHPKFRVRPYTENSNLKDYYILEVYCPITLILWFGFYWDWIPVRKPSGDKVLSKNFEELKSMAISFHAFPDEYEKYINLSKPQYFEI